MNQEELKEIFIQELGEVDPGRVVIGTGALIHSDGRFLFVFSREKYWENGEVSFQNVGGEVEKGENPLQALKREAREEISSEIEVKDSSETFGPDLNPKLDKNPLLIYTEENSGKPGNPEAGGSWHLLGFLFRAELKGEAVPSGEIPALMKIPPETFYSSKQGLNKEKIEQEGELVEKKRIPENFTAYPKFSAQRILENRSFRSYLEG